MKKIVIITRFESEYNVYDKHPFLENKTLSLLEKHPSLPLCDYLKDKLNMPFEQDIIEDVIRLNYDAVLEWSKTNKETETLLKIKKEQLKSDKWNNDSDKQNFINAFKKDKVFCTEFKNKIDDKQKEKKKEIEKKSINLFKYKKISLRGINKEWDGDIILLPCYADSEFKSVLNYDPDTDRESLLKAIKDTFLEDNPAIDNYLYIHDKEWANTGGDDYRETNAAITQTIKQYFNDNIRIFNHSQSSFYFTQILVKTQNLMNVEIFEINRDILINPLDIDLNSIYDEAIKSKLQEVYTANPNKNFTLEDIYKIEEALFF
jgi:hypothetical protein